MSKAFIRPTTILSIPITACCTGNTHKTSDILMNVGPSHISYRKWNYEINSLTAKAAKRDICQQKSVKRVSISADNRLLQDTACSEQHMWSLLSKSKLQCRCDSIGIWFEMKYKTVTNCKLQCRDKVSKLLKLYWFAYSTKHNGE